MGLKETDSYGGAGRGGDEDRSKLPRLSRGFRSTINIWVEDLRGGDGDDSSCLNVLKRFGRCVKDLVDEVPGFARSLAAGSIRHLIILMLLVLCAFSIGMRTMGWLRIVGSFKL